MNLINYKVTIRNARKNGIISFAKIFGLSISFAVILFAVSYVYYETSFDRNVTDANRIYRCLMQGHFNNEDADYAVTSSAEGPSLLAEVPEITESLRMFNQGEADISSNKKDYLKGKLFYSDPNFFSFWSVSINSNIEEPLAANNSLVVSESTAKKLFGSANEALGKSVTFRSNECVITGVFADLPKNFHLEIDFLQSLKKELHKEPNWGNQSYYTYIKTVSPDMDIDDLNFKISKNVYTHYHDLDGYKAETMDDLKRSDDFYLFYIAEPLTDIHFSKHKFDPAKTANKTYVFGAVILAVLVLLISSVNFINLSIANLSTRYKEVGIRKTIGAFKGHILGQFLNETFVFFSVSLVFALTIFFIIGDSLSQSLGFDIALNKTNLIKIIAISSAFLFILMLSINVIPIWVTSRNKTLNLIKGKSNNRKQQWGNNTFVLVQFMLSVVIVLSSIIMNRQINYMITKEKGYNSENILKINLWRLSDQQRESFMEQLKTYSAIQTVCSSMRYIGEDPGMNDAYFENTADEENYFHPSLLPVDARFAETFGIKMKEGRFFDGNRKTDNNAVVINEAAAAEYKKEGSLIGKKLIFNNGEFEIIGIVDDFNFRSLHHSIEPLLLSYSENQGNVYMKIAMENSAEAIGVTQNLWDEYNINQPFGYEFLDDVLARNYAKDQQAKKLLHILSILSIIIACVGLYAVSFFSIIRKTKEIGIRKVNGAKIFEVMTMLNKDFVKWVAIAFVIATPIAYYAMNKWLENFAYKTNLSWWIFALAGVLALGIALLTVSWQSWRAAKRNPVEALRYE
jgi:putative ABC transport system permease protein